MRFQLPFNYLNTRRCLLFIRATAFAALLLTAASVVSAQEKANSSTNEYWKKQRERALEERSEAIGAEADGLEIPAELSGEVGKQMAKMAELAKNTAFKMPMDFADLASQRAAGTLVDVPLVTENYLLDVGGSAAQTTFSSFSFDKGNSKLSASQLNSLSTLAKNFDGTKYDLNIPADRKQMRVRLLRMLHPAAKSILEEIAIEYKNKFDRPLRVTSLVRSMDYQIELNKTNPNSYRVNGRSSLPPHVSGLAFDIAFRYLTAGEQNFLMQKIAQLEKDGRIDGLREGSDAQVFHIFAYPDGKFRKP